MNLLKIGLQSYCENFIQQLTPTLENHFTKYLSTLFGNEGLYVFHAYVVSKLYKKIPENLLCILFIIYSFLLEFFNLYFNSINKFLFLYNFFLVILSILLLF